MIWHDIPNQLEDAIGVLFVISRANPPGKVTVCYGSHDPLSPLIYPLK